MPHLPEETPKSTLPAGASAAPVRGEAAQQFGIPHLKFRCPKCGTPGAVSNPGHVVCPTCDMILEVTR